MWIYYAFCFSDEEELDSELHDLQNFLRRNVPIFESPPSGYNVYDVLRIIQDDVPKRKLCTQKPCGVRSVASFVVDLKCVNFKDLSADDNGVWVTSSPRRMYEIIRGKYGKIESLRNISKISHGMNRCNIVTICRQYGKHQGYS